MYSTFTASPKGSSAELESRQMANTSSEFVSKHSNMRLVRSTSDAAGSAGGPSSDRQEA